MSERKLLYKKKRGFPTKKNRKRESKMHKEEFINKHAYAFSCS